jgi:hypothetical protein
MPVAPSSRIQSIATWSLAGETSARLRKYPSPCVIQPWYELVNGCSATSGCTKTLPPESRNTTRVL